LPDDYWVLVQDGKVIKSGKGKPRFTSSRGQELMTVKYAKKMMSEKERNALLVELETDTDDTVLTFDLVEIMESL